MEIKQHNIPAELKDLKQWVLWKFETVDGKQTKVPLGKSNDPSTWSSYKDVLSNLDGKHGLGFMFSPESRVMGIDMDHIDTTEGKKRAQEILKQFSSYTEISPSGTGYHILVKAKKNTTKCKNNEFDLEFYDQKRFFTMTGNVVAGMNKIEERQEAVDWFEQKYFFADKSQEPVHLTPTAISLSDKEILDLALNASNGAKTASLYKGEIGSYNNDASAADLALASIIAFYTQDIGQIERIMKSSRLYREKWVKRKDIDNWLVKWCIEPAIRGLKETYSPSDKLEPFNTKVNNKDSIIKTGNEISKDLKEDFELAKTAPKTGIAELDSIIKGFIPKHVYTMSGETNIGKTSLCCNFAHSVAKQGKKVLYFALEPGVSVIHYVASVQEKTTFYEVSKNLPDFNDNIHYVVSGVDSPEVLIKVLESAKDDYDLVIIDHIGYFSSGGDNYIHDQSKTVKIIAKFAKQFKVAVLMVAHINKQASKKKSQILTYNDISGSAAFKQDSTEVLLVNKNSNGKTGVINVAKTKMGREDICGIRFMENSAFIEGDPQGKVDAT